MTSSAKPRLPIITIGGFLGSGKTTLVNRLLAEADGQRLVVFVNDFGAINIDYALVETVEEDRISLTNGCVCCSLNENLVTSVAEFANSENPPDAIVIEASGVADPRALDSSFNILEASGAARVDTRVYVMDADCFGGLNYEDSELIIDHAAASDIVLLNKCDLAEPVKLKTLEELLAESAPYSAVIRTEHCDISLNLVLCNSDILPRSGPRNVETANHNNHATRFSHWSGKTSALIDRRKFQALAETLPHFCLRSKGVLRFSDAPDQLVSFNLVGVRATYESLDLKIAPTQSQLVIIGREEAMNHATFKQQFHGCEHSPSS